MKNAIIGGFLTIVSSMWAIAIGVYVQTNLVSQWSDSRFWETASKLNVIFPLIMAFIVLALGIIVMGIEYFRKDK